jgi:hypothetical protein
MRRVDRRWMQVCNEDAVLELPVQDHTSSDNTTELGHQVAAHLQ